MTAVDGELVAWAGRCLTEDVPLETVTGCIDLVVGEGGVEMGDDFALAFVEALADAGWLIVPKPEWASSYPQDKSATVMGVSNEARIRAEAARRWLEEANNDDVALAIAVYAARDLLNGAIEWLGPAKAAD